MSVTGNFDEVNSALNAYKATMDERANNAISQIARQIYRNAYNNADQIVNKPTRVTISRGPNKGKQYTRYNRHIGGEGTGPNRATGTLLNSMTFSSRRAGFGSYVAEYGVNTSYARALEFGVGKSGVKYPYVQPALNKLIKGGQLSQILMYAFKG